MKHEKKDNKKKRYSDLPVSVGSSCIELSGNREVLIEGSKGVLEYSPETIRVNTADMILSVFGRGLDLRCISESALIIDGFVTRLEFTV